MVINIEKFLEPNRDSFAADPFGYSVLAWNKWTMIQAMAGDPVEVEKPATSNDLKDPVLWLTQAHVLSEAAVTIIKRTPSYESMPEFMKGVCDSQYCAVGLMLVGYSLEICLKAILIMKNGVQGYIQMEKKNRHHNLEKLAEFIPELNEKDKAILRGLTHFVYWAGRYPDPGSGRDDKLEEIFHLSEQHKISAHNLFELSKRIMGVTRQITNGL